MLVTSTISYADWIELADEYYLAARSLQWFSGLAYPTTYAGHHALELYLKSVTVRNDGTYDNQQHNLRTLYETAIAIEPAIESAVVTLAIDSYWNYDQPARYTSTEVRSQNIPSNDSMGTDSLGALDLAVASLRDIKVATRKGLDRLVEGETELTVLGHIDPNLALNSVLLFHNNNAFKPKRPEVMDSIRFSAPTWQF